jgi:hypothetical protein
MPTATQAAIQSVELPTPSRVLLTVKQMAQQQPALSEGGIRWDLFNRDHNGLAKSGAIFRRGRRILLDPEIYLKWLETRRELVA